MNKIFIFCSSLVLLSKLHSSEQTATEVSTDPTFAMDMSDSSENDVVKTDPLEDPSSITGVTTDPTLASEPLENSSDTSDVATDPVFASDPLENSSDTSDVATDPVFANDMADSPGNEMEKPGQSEDSSGATDISTDSTVENQDDSIPTTSVCCEPIPDPCSSNCLLSSVILEARFSYFYPSSHVFRKIYGSGINYELALTAPIWGNLNIWGAVDYFTKDGHSIGDHQRTSIRMVPLTLGLKYIYPINSLSIYAGLGMRYFFVHTKNHSHYVDSTINRSGMGGVAELGFLYCFKDHFVFDVFTNYSFEDLDGPSPHHHNVYKRDSQVGGWNTGAGIGYKF